jgi:hypothetical protein
MIKPNDGSTSMVVSSVGLIGPRAIQSQLILRIKRPTK